MKNKKLLKRIFRIECEVEVITRNLEVITHDFKREIETLWETFSFAQKRIVELEGSEVHATSASTDASREQELGNAGGESHQQPERGRIAKMDKSDEFYTVTLTEEDARAAVLAALQNRIAELEAENAELKARPIYVPYYPSGTTYPQYPYPYPTWTVITDNKTGGGVK